MSKGVAPAAGRIPLPRLVVGILLHFCVPAYLLACLIAGFAVDPPARDGAEVVARMLWTGAWFVPAFLLMTAVSASVAKMVERRMPPPSPDETAIARAQLGEARRVLAGLDDGRLYRLIARLDSVAWNFGDPSDQRVLADLSAAARTFGIAVDSAPPEGRADVLALAGDSVERLAAAGEALAAGHSRLDRGDAQTVARYISSAYR